MGGSALLLRQLGRTRGTFDTLIDFVERRGVPTGKPEGICIGRGQSRLCRNRRG